MQTYLELAEFCKLVHLNEDAVKGMMANGALNFKEEQGKIYIEANQGTFQCHAKQHKRGCAYQLHKLGWGELC